MSKKEYKKPFIPPKLPPKGVDYSNILEEITATREVIARYDEALKRLPNPDIIEHSFETKEAVLSSRIEGTQVTLDEVLEFDAENLKQQQTEKEKDYREVINYRKAIKKGEELLGNKPLSENLIKKLHSILLNSARGQNRAPGAFRKNKVFIGPKGADVEDAKFIPPPPQKIVELFSNLEKYLHSEKAPDPIVQIAIAHYQFEAIHPFMDGNGRVGRIIIPLFLYEKGLTSSPSIYISEYLEKHRQEYYERLRAVSNNNEWLPWIKFFLRSLREQIDITGKRVKQAENLYRDLMKRSPEFNSIYAHNFIEAIFKKPVFSAQKIKKIAGIKNNQTLYNLLEKFIEAEVVFDITPEKERNKLYVFDELMKIIS